MLYMQHLPQKVASSINPSTIVGTITEANTEFKKIVDLAIAADEAARIEKELERGEDDVVVEYQNAALVEKQEVLRRIRSSNIKCSNGT